MQWLPGQFSGAEYRSTDGTVFCVVEGHGRVSIDGMNLEFAPHDVFVVPSWAPYRFETEHECILFSYSDRAAQEALGMWREWPGTHAHAKDSMDFLPSADDRLGRYAR